MPRSSTYFALLAGRFFLLTVDCGKAIRLNSGQMPKRSLGL